MVVEYNGQLWFCKFNLKSGCNVEAKEVELPYQIDYGQNFYEYMDLSMMKERVRIFSADLTFPEATPRFTRSLHVYSADVQSSWNEGLNKSGGSGDGCDTLNKIKSHPPGGGGSLPNPS